MRAISIGEINEIINKDAGLSIIRAKSAPFVIAFLYNTFYLNSVSSLTYDDFASKLEVFLSENSEAEDEFEREIQEDEEELISTKDISSRIRAYIESWLSDRKHYIRRYRNQEKVEIIELDAGLSRLLPFIARIINSNEITTESSFNYILTQLKSLANNINRNPKERIKELEKQIEELQAEKAEIQKTNKVKTFDTRKTKEYLMDLEKHGREMLGEFSQLEENFRQIMNNIAIKQADVDDNKKILLGYSLSLHKELYSSPQGQSFESFWAYMMRNQEDQITRLTDEIEENLKREEIDYDDSFLRSLRSLFYDAGKRVVKKNSILTERMSKVMATKSKSERKGLIKLLSELKATAASLKNNEEAQEKITMSLNTEPDLSFPLSRTLRLEKEENITPIILYEDKTSNTDAIRALKSEFYIDEKKLENNINEYFFLTKKSSFTLSELVSYYPILKGLEEIIYYISLAEKRDIYAINKERKEEITYSWNDKRYTVLLDEVTFYAK